MKESAALLSVTLTSILLILLFFRLRLYPFGDYTLLYADGGQYAAFYRTVIDRVANGESLLYSFHRVLGGGLIPTIAYYAASPFNLLFLFFKDNLIAGIHFVACVKSVAASVTFCILLNERGAVLEGTEETSLRTVLLRGVFSTCYAFIGYMVFYFWNLSWMDGVIALPLIVLGLFRLIEKKKILLYVLSLGYAILANYYIGYMICIASLIIYVFYHFVHAETTGELLASFKGSVVRFLFASVLAAGINGFLLFTVIRNLPDARMKSANEAYESMRGIFNFTRFFSGFFTGRTDVQSDNLPIIYFGVIPFLIVICYFFDRSKALFKKITLIALAGIFFLSFWNSMINMVWHGMTGNAWFNYRYSFLFSFLMLYFAYAALHRIDGHAVRFRYLAIGIAVFYAWVVNDTMGLFYAKEIMYDVAQIIAGIYLLRTVTTARNDTPVTTVTTDMTTTPADDTAEATQNNIRLTPYVIMSLLMLVGCYMNAAAVSTVDVRSSLRASSFLERKTEREAQVRSVQEMEEDGDFYRMDFVTFYTRNDAFLSGYNGVTNYTSTEHAPLLDLLREMGLQHDWIYGNYSTHMPLAAESFTGLHYLIGDVADNHKQYVRTKTENGTAVLRNDAALPLMHLSKELYQGENADAFTRMNRMYQAFDTDVTEQIFYTLPLDMRTDETGATHFATITTREKPLYLYLPEGTFEASVYAETGEIDSGTALTGYATQIDHADEQRIYYIGTFSAGTQIEVVLADETLVPDLGAVYLAYEETDAVYAYAEAVSQQEITCSVEKDDRITAQVATNHPAYLTTTIPYDAGWTVTVDGEKVQTEPYLGELLAVPLSAGAHTIEMTYVPRGLKAGTCVSVFCLVVLLIYVVTARKKSVNGRSNEVNAS